MVQIDGQWYINQLGAPNLLILRISLPSSPAYQQLFKSPSLFIAKRVFEFCMYDDIPETFEHEINHLHFYKMDLNFSVSISITFLSIL